MRPLMPALAPMLALCALTTTLSACAPTQVIQVPTVEVQEVRLTSLTLPAGLIGTLTGAGAPVANLSMNLRVTNPNPLPIRMANIGGQLVIDGAEVGLVNLPNVDLPAQGSTTQLAQVAIPVTLNTASSFLKVARGEQVTYRLDGTFSVNFGLLGTQTFGPFTLSQGQWKQPPIIRF